MALLATAVRFLEDRFDQYSLTPTNNVNNVAGWDDKQWTVRVKRQLLALLISLNHDTTVLEKQTSSSENA